jgi:two-component system cell cycle response regulator
VSVALTTAVPGLAELRPRTVLIVDHRESIRRVLSLILEAEGIQSVTTDEAHVAIDLAREILPDAMTLDLGQADGEATALLRTLKADPLLKHVPRVVLVSCRGAREIAEQYGAAAILNTPVDLDELLRRIQVVTA